ncbi:RHTO0S27e01398g1_1 [Rhodotorula toruloides]|uniref:RHTO0S27e01398g1_1 n=1 Tax=Rhodotorula toruloides TaxID=5286 RepID=A0A061BNF9_RHOTO|nr:RHTO0S27e01398g1_1 [Rhodotorula toruloides]
MLAYSAVQDAQNSSTFCDFIIGELIPTMRPFSASEQHHRHGQVLDSQDPAAHRDGRGFRLRDCLSPTLLARLRLSRALSLR